MGFILGMKWKLNIWASGVVSHYIKKDNGKTTEHIKRFRKSIFQKSNTLKKNLCKQGIELCRPNKDILQLTAHLKLGNGKLPMELRNTARAPSLCIWPLLLNIAYKVPFNKISKGNKRNLTWKKETKPPVFRNDPTVCEDGLSRKLNR